MNVRAALAAALLLFAPEAVSAQGYGGLGAAPEGFAQVTPGREFAFPRDHGPHAGYRIEWWYVTANLEGPEGEAYGAQWTLFRQSISADPATDGWTAPQVWMGHAAVTTADDHRSTEKFGRGGTGQAGATLAPFRAWIDDWRLESVATAPDAPFSPLRLTASAADFAVDLELVAEGPFALQGDRGYSRKSERAQASYYYSNPFLAVTGAVVIDGRRTPVAGRAWLDREWSTTPLDVDQEGWDWFALHLPEGEKLMVYRMRHADGRDWHASSWIGTDGAVDPLEGDAIAMRPLETARVAGRDVPVAWEIEIPSRGLRIVTRPLNPKSWMDTSVAYWEGPIRFEGSHEGIGYLEMTGY